MPCTSRPAMTRNPLHSARKESPRNRSAFRRLGRPNERLPLVALRGAGYGGVAHGQRAWNGVAVLARGGEPIETGRGLADMEDALERHCVKAVVHGVLIGCLCLPPHPSTTGDEIRPRAPMGRDVQPACEEALGKRRARRAGGR